MMDVYICENITTDRNIIHDSCNEYYINNNYDGEIHETDNGDTLISMIREADFSSIYFIDCNEMSQLMMDRLWENCRGSFIVLVAENMVNILEAINPAVRPSGVLLLPVERKRVIEVLKKIFDNYTKEIGDSLTYRFKIKSRLYSVDIINIDYFEASSKKMILRTSNQEYEFYENFESIISVLPEFFIRIHKSFLINARNVKNIDYKEMWVSFKDGSKAYISRGYRKDLEEYFSRLQV